MSDRIYVTIFWHQHQPHYLDPETGRLALPWVRLHAVKDYVDMALLAERFDFKQTINLVPTLLEQLQGYADGTLTDDALELSRCAAADLTDGGRKTLLARFFDANQSTMIRPNARYLELLRDRERDAGECLKKWTEQDWRDLQVWFNLAWMDPMWTESKDDVSNALAAKGRNFTEDDKAALLDRHLELCGEVAKVHKRLQDEGKIEVTVTPYAHPILPLLCDTGIARMCQPGDPLPRPPFRYPEDADMHLAKAVEIYERNFGFAPKGMWPSEGSVSPEALAKIRKHGIQWCASDEGVIGGSAVEIEGVQKASGADPYRPYVFDTEDGPLHMIFRDHELSDHIGFHYFNTPAPEAAAHFVNRLVEKVRAAIPKGPALAPVILDGENCWEHFPRDGHDFLEALTRALQKHPDIKAATVSEMLEEFPGKRVGTIQRLRPGSWIHSNFRIWIGGPEENLAWDILRRVRESLGSVANELEPAKAEAAWQHIAWAEGSDWFWWYGDTNVSDHDAFYDALFRGHLRCVLENAGLPVLPELETSLSEQVEAQPEERPTGRLSAPPRLDRSQYDFFAWQGAVPLTAGAGGAMHEVTGRDWSGWIGWCGKKAYLKIVLDPETRQAVTRGRSKLCWRLQPGGEHEVQVMRFAELDVSEAPIPREAWDKGYIEVEVLLYEKEKVIDQLPSHGKAILDLAPGPVWLL